MSKSTQSNPPTPSGVFGQNIVYEKDGNILTLKIDLSKTLGESASGKSNNIATTGGNISMPWDDAMKLGINLYKKK